MKKRFSNNKGFSLVELIIVVAIMAILIGILAPQYMKYVEKSRISADKDTIDEIAKTAQTLLSDPDYKGTEPITVKLTGKSTTTLDKNTVTGPTNVKDYTDIAGTSVTLKSKAFTSKTITVTVDTTNGVSISDGTNTVTSASDL